MDMQIVLRHFTAASVTSLNPISFNAEQSPLEGLSAMLLKELTLASQQVDLSLQRLRRKRCSLFSLVPKGSHKFQLHMLFMSVYEVK